MPQDFRIIAYVTDAIVESIIPYDKLTHINYAFLIPKDDGTFNPISNAWKLQRIAKNAHARGVKVLVSVGGWGWEKQFEVVSASPETRGIFVRNLKAVVDGYQIDGADIDWEYPAAGQSADNFLSLIRELRVALPGRLLTTAVVSHGENAAGILPETFELFDLLTSWLTMAPNMAPCSNLIRACFLVWPGRPTAKDCDGTSILRTGQKFGGRGYAVFQTRESIS
ncbi:probable chitinase 3 [Anaerolineaceae bacterium]|nr:probable chitinase 3 [Anaerolineaceae bacterium]